MQAAIHCHAQIGDYVKFLYNANNNNNNQEQSLGEVLHYSSNVARVKLFQLMSSEVQQRYMLRPINSTDYPLTSQDNICEVFQTNEEMLIDRSLIVDLAFIVPVSEIESGMFYLSGAINTYCIRFSKDGSKMKPVSPILYFGRYLVEPLGVRIFMALNALSQHLRRAMHQTPESKGLKRTFRLPFFPMECFWYLVQRVGADGLFTSTNRKQCLIKYFSCLRMEAITKLNTISYLRILSQQSLQALRGVLGAGTGLGLARKRPTKSSPIQCCQIGGLMTSVECIVDVPDYVVEKPESNYTANGIDFIYYEQSRCLSCIVRFTKITVNTEEDATSRIAGAIVEHIPESGVYVTVWFSYEDRLLEVVAIHNETRTVTCSYVEQPGSVIDLPLTLVSTLVASFGRS
jgi:hypothetical protein